MLLQMKTSRDLYYAGELVEVDKNTAAEWIAAGLAEPAVCPECGAQLEARGWGAVCPECGNRKWESIA
ncbi:hypothetical protein [Moorella sp. E306M]|uniref:hypothetical protein n=1 Tax=Moorella sp. E306M TaxID=2572683 RepID=UPI0010FFC637|nr:hypothetical protein [Moorella sp. E306M]GEA17474.1 hypothetical protein E306M_06080 [Moorella sp. E306M]